VDDEAVIKVIWIITLGIAAVVAAIVVPISFHDTAASSNTAAPQVALAEAPTALCRHAPASVAAKCYVEAGASILVAECTRAENQSNWNSAYETDEGEAMQQIRECVVDAETGTTGGTKTHG
jgi:hypothetical protein